MGVGGGGGRVGGVASAPGGGGKDANVSQLRKWLIFR